jgi:hypothetical protein
MEQSRIGKNNMEQMDRLTNVEYGEEGQLGKEEKNNHQTLEIQTNYLKGSSNL